MPDKPTFSWFNFISWFPVNFFILHKHLTEFERKADLESRSERVLARTNARCNNYIKYITIAIDCLHPSVDNLLLIYLCFSD